MKGRLTHDQSFYTKSTYRPLVVGSELFASGSAKGASAKVKSFWPFSRKSSVSCRVGPAVPTDRSALRPKVRCFAMSPSKGKITSRCSQNHTQSAAAGSSLFAVNGSREWDSASLVRTILCAFHLVERLAVAVAIAR